MSEPREIACGLDRVVDGVYHWRITNSAIGGAISSSHAIVDGERCALIDPVGVEPKVLQTLPRPSAILLTARCHQRAAWRFRRELGAEVWLPLGAAAAEEEPDHLYGDGDVLPLGVVAVHTPGPEKAHYSFLLARGGGVLFCSDLVANDGTAGLHLIPPEYQDDAEQARLSIVALLDLPFETLCLAHGTPVTDDPKRALEEVLAAAPTGAHA